SRVSRRQHHGRGAWNGEAAGARAQTRHRRASRRERDSGELHQRVLGRPQRDQAVGDFSHRLSRMVLGDGRRSGDDAGVSGWGAGGRGRGAALIALLVVVAVVALAQSWNRWLDPIIDTGRDLYISEQ